MTMKKVIVTGIMVVLLLAVNHVHAQSCQIINGSFEDDGYIPDIKVKEPNGWDVNIPTGKFKGFVDNDWSTDPNYSLTLHTQTWKTFSIGDMATVSQEVDLTDTNEIFFDLKLESWNANKVSAVMLIDSNVVWDSNNLGSGTYYYQSYTVEEKYRDGELHTASFGIRVKVSEMLYIFYITKWDYIECVPFECLPGDLNHNGFVDFIDFALLANYWGEAPPAEYDLFPDGTIDYNDLEVFVKDWLKRSCIVEPSE
jgi:hypothetical protein